MYGGAAAAGWRSPAFTAAQWVELEHQALIYKYLTAGVPVPPDLLLPIRRSFFHFSALGYPSYYGKKLDPEPGRCRRTDGKKWRCSKDAHPDSKYCERHMHRSRNRSRKPVETHVLSQSQSSSSTGTSLSSAVSRSGSGSGGGSFQSFPLTSVSGGSNPHGWSNCASSSLLNLDSASYGFGNKEFRYLHGAKPEVDEQKLLSEMSGNSKGFGMELDSSWCSIRSELFPLSPTKTRHSLLPGSYPHLHPDQNLGQVDINPLSTQAQQQQQHSFGSVFGSSEPAKHESQLLRPFFDEWPKTRDSWSGLGDQRSATQLSISIPMPSTEFSAPHSR